MDHFFIYRVEVTVGAVYLNESDPAHRTGLIPKAKKE